MFVKKWMPHRTYLEKFRVDFEDFEEEKTFQVLVSKFKIFEVVKAKKLEFAVEWAADKLTKEEVKVFTKKRADAQEAMSPGLKRVIRRQSSLLPAIPEQDEEINETKEEFKIDVDGIKANNRNKIKQVLLNGLQNQTVL